MDLVLKSHYISTVVNHQRMKTRPSRDQSDLSLVHLNDAKHLDATVADEKLLLIRKDKQIIINSNSSCFRAQSFHHFFKTSWPHTKNPTTTLRFSEPPTVQGSFPSMV